MKRIAIYPGTFDPITHGHSDLCQRASFLFDEVILAVALSPGKHTTFSAEQRIQVAKQALHGLNNIKIMPFQGLLTAFAAQCQAGVVLRGLRAMSDFEYEFQLAAMNRNLNPTIETLFLTTAQQYAFLSSSLVREVALLGGDVSSFVHPAVEALLKSLKRDS